MMGMAAWHKRRRKAAVGLAALLGVALLPGGAVAEEAAYGPVSDDAHAAPASAGPAGLPPGLALLAERALADNPQVLASRAALAASEAELDAARWQRFPSLTAEALAATGGSNVADRNGLALNLALEQPLWAGRTIANRIAAARSQRDAGAEALREARLGILSGLIEAWFGVVRAEERARALEAGIAEHRALADSIARRVAQEVSPRADLTLARARTTQLEIELVAVREAAASALLRLQELAGAVPDPPSLPGPEIFAAVPPEPVALEELTACAPALGRLRSQMAAAEAELRSARGALAPQVLLQLSQNELTGARGALVLRAQSGAGLSRFAAIDRAEARLEQASAALDAAERELRTRLASEYVALRANRAQAEAGSEASLAAAELLASYQRQFVAGRRSWLDVMNAAREVVSARITESDARVDAAANAVRILALSCRWRPGGL
jgi:adhesin transport system outer membrane protein